MAPASKIPHWTRGTQGVRQGCAVAPVLWLIYSHLISTELAGLIGHEAACELLSIFADDYHCSTLFNSLRQLESKLSHIGALFRVLGRLGMTISHAKSEAILVCKGKGSAVMKRMFTRRTKQGRVLRFAHAQEVIDIPLIDSFVYLGAVASYGPFEDQTLEHRLQTGRANFWRLHRCYVVSMLYPDPIESISGKHVSTQLAPMDSRHVASPARGHENSPKKL